MGSGGANDLGNAAQEILVVANQRAQTFVPQVDYITTPGSRVRNVVSSMGLYERRDGELVLVGVFESAGEEPREVVESIRARCGFELRVADELLNLSRASDEEIATLRLFDPERAFLGKARH